MKKIARVLALLLVGATLLSGCSMLTASGRRERAYERYVRKSSLGRVKQQKRLSAKKPNMPVIPAIQSSGPTAVTEASSSDSAGDGGGE
jgi:hypothetical protein